MSLLSILEVIGGLLFVGFICYAIFAPAEYAGWTWFGGNDGSDGSDAGGGD